MVETVRGPVDVDALGVTLMHEQNYGDEWWDEEERVADAIAKLRALTALGVDTIVDPTGRTCTASRWRTRWPLCPVWPRLRWSGCRTR